MHVQKLEWRVATNFHAHQQNSSTVGSKPTMHHFGQYLIMAIYDYSWDKLLQKGQKKERLTVKISHLNPH